MTHLASTDVELWDKVLAGQTGFAFATIVFGLFFWRVILPRWDRQAAAIERLADGIALLISKQTDADSLQKIEAIRGHKP